MRIRIHPMVRETRASRALNAWLAEVDDKGNKLRTQTDLAKIVSARLGRTPEVNQSSVSAWCSGRSQPRGDVMVVLQEVASIPLPWWLEVVDSNSGTNAA